MERSFVIEIIEIATGAITIIGSLTYGIRKYIYLPLKSLKNLAEVTITEVTETSEVLKKHSEILKELEPNSGGTIKDRIKKISENVDEVYITIDQLVKFNHTQLDLVPYAVWQSNSKGENTFINDAYKELFEVDLINAVDYKWMSLIHEEDLNGYNSLWQNTLEYKTDVTTVIRVITYRTKKILKCKVYWKVTLKDNGDIDYITGKLKAIDT